MTVCPFANVRCRRHSHDVFKGVKNFYDTRHEHRALKEHSTFVFVCLFFNSSNTIITAARYFEMGHLTHVPYNLCSDMCSTNMKYLRVCFYIYIYCKTETYHCICVCVCIYIYIYIYLYLCVCIYRQGKAIPLQAWTGPAGSRSLRLPDFKTIRT